METRYRTGTLMARLSAFSIVLNYISVQRVFKSRFLILGQVKLGYVAVPRSTWLNVVGVEPKRLKKQP